MSPCGVTGLHSFNLWRIHALVKWVTFGAGNGLSQMFCEAIIWTNGKYVAIIDHQGSTAVKFNSKYRNVFEENEYKNVTCKMASTVVITFVFFYRIFPTASIWDWQRQHSGWQHCNLHCMCLLTTELLKKLRLKKILWKRNLCLKITIRQRNHLKNVDHR